MTDYYLTANWRIITMGFSPKITAITKETFTVPDSDATVTIKYLKSGIMSNLSQASMQFVSKQQDSGSMAAEVSFNSAKKNRDICVACVTGWSGFEDADGNNLKFTKVNLLKMIDESEEFVEWIVECQEKLAASVEGEEEAVEKN